MKSTIKILRIIFAKDRGFNKRKWIIIDENKFFTSRILIIKYRIKIINL